VAEIEEYATFLLMPEVYREGGLRLSGGGMGAAAQQ
jgi:hypothetical protein